MKRPIALALVLALGCKGKTNVEADATPSDEAAFAGTEAMDLAVSAASVKAPSARGSTNPVFAYTAARGLTLDGRVIVAPPTAPARGFDAKDKRPDAPDLLVVPLESAAATRAASTALLAFEASTPYRIVAEVAFTLGQRAYATLELLVKAPSGERRVFAMPLPTAALPCGETVTDAERDLAILHSIYGDAAPPPAVAVVPLASRDPLCVSIEVASEGLVVRSRRDRLDSSCGELAPPSDPTPKTLAATSTSRLPLGAAAICANTIKKRFPKALASRVTLRASGETPWRDVVAMVDVFGPPSGFGDPILGAPPK